MAGAPQTRDYFAELYVAGMFGDAGWTVYFPKRDYGFDFIATKFVQGQTVLRAVQVKGKYPEKDSAEARVYGWDGTLSATHPEMVLALAFFDAHERQPAPSQIAFMPFHAVSLRANGDLRCVPAKFKGNRVLPRETFVHYFGEPGLKAVEDPTWHLKPAPADAEGDGQSK